MAHLLQHLLFWPLSLPAAGVTTVKPPVWMVARTLVRVHVPMGVLVEVQAVQAAAPIAHLLAAEVLLVRDVLIAPMTVLHPVRKHVKVHALNHVPTPVRGQCKGNQQQVL